MGDTEQESAASKLQTFQQKTKLGQPALGAELCELKEALARKEKVEVIAEVGDVIYCCYLGMRLGLRRGLRDLVKKYKCKDTRVVEDWNQYYPSIPRPAQPVPRLRQRSWVQRTRNMHFDNMHDSRQGLTGVPTASRRDARL